MSRIGSNRIGTNGEVYCLEATKHQTFVSSWICKEDASRKDKVKAIANTLRSMADELDKHAKVDQFFTDYDIYAGKSSELIKTDLITLDAKAYLDDPLSQRHFGLGNGWKVNIELELGFE